jgi:DNA/RNA-binding domain of Phe-tRNA-synthetase-like protein
MGTTCTSLHVLRPQGKPDAFLAALKTAYAKIGFAPTTEPAATGLKRVIVSDDGQSKFVSVHDSDNALIDSGQLKELAVVPLQAPQVRCRPHQCL